MYIIPKWGNGRWHIVKDTERDENGVAAVFTTACGKKMLAFSTNRAVYRDHMRSLCKACDRALLADALVEGS